MAQKWLNCGQGTLKHPVSGASVTTQIVELEDFGGIGEWFDYSNTPQENLALITSAPELLEALKELLKEVDQHCESDCPKFIASVHVARVVIAKAKGL